MRSLKIRKFADKSKPGPPWPLARIVLADPDVPFDHVMSWQYVDAARAEGWAYILDDILELRFSNATLRYKIVEGPGSYTDFDAPAGRRVEHGYTLQLIELV